MRQAAKAIRRAARHGRVLAAAAATCLVGLATAGPAPAANQWHEGGNATTQVLNCASVIQGYPYYEIGTYSWVGYWADSSNLPGPNETWYGHSIVGVVGNSCAGHKIAIEVTPPPDSQFAVTAGTPIACYLFKFADSNAQPIPLAAGSQCPTQVVQGTYGGRFDNPAAGDKLWELPPGWWVEIQYPLRATRRLNGTAASPCDCLWGWNRVLDGNSSPWVHPDAPVWLASAPGGGGGNVPGPGTDPPPNIGAEPAPPKTTITRGPRGKTRKRRATFRFKADRAGVRFQCKLDGQRFRPCASPRTVRRLKLGKHVFRVRAIAGANNLGKPASRSWTVRR